MEEEKERCPKCAYLTSNVKSGEECELAKQLKEICDSEGKENHPKQSAEIFHKLGKIYFERNTKVSLIRSATLYNAAIIRKCKNVKHIKKDLKILCSRVLKEAGASKLDADLIESVIEVQKKIKISDAVKEMRKKINAKLNVKRKKELTGKSKEEEKIKQIRKLQKDIVEDYTRIMSGVLLFCVNVKGSPPCKFALVGMGSLARKEITPYSDFEHIIVLEENAEKRHDYQEILKYFSWLSVIFQIVLINLKETILPSVDIKSLKTADQNKCWLYDSITPRGICFDGMMPHACKFPLGHQVLSENDENEPQFIRSVNEMLKHLTSDQSFKTGYHLKDILTKVCYVGGDKTIFEDFQKKVHDLIDQQDESRKIKEIKKMLVEDLDNFATRSNFLNLKSKSFNIKKDLYRSTTIFISALGRLENIHASSCFDIVEELAKQGKIDEYLHHKFMYAVALGCEFRLRWYMKRERQDDNIEAQSRQETIQKLIDCIEATELISYFAIAYALQCDISQKFDLKKLHFYSDPRLLLYKLYYCFGNNKIFEVFSQKNIVSEKSPRLQSVKEMLNIFEKELKQSKKVKEIKTVEKVKKTYNFGLKLYTNGNYDDALEFFEIILDIIQLSQVSSDMEEETRVIVLQKCGECCLELNKKADGINFYEELRKIQEKASPNIPLDIDYARTLTNLGICLVYANKIKQAFKYLKLSKEIKERVSLKDNNMALTLSNLGLCSIKMNNLVDAMKYFQDSLEAIKKTLSCESFQPSLVCHILIKISDFLLDLDKPADAVEHILLLLEISLKESVDITLEKELIKNLKKLSFFFTENQTPAEAINKLRQWKTIYENASVKSLSNIDVARSLSIISKCLVKIQKPADALECLHEVEKFYQNESLDPSTDINLAGTLNTIGVCYFKLQKLPEAKNNIEESFNIYKKRSTNNELEFGKTTVLTKLDARLCKTHQLDSVKTFFEIPLPKINQNVWDVNAALTLNNKGLCCIKMHKPSDALGYLENALKIRKSASFDASKDVKIASTLRHIGLCFMNMHKSVDALDYLQRSLNIFIKVSLDIALDFNLASTLSKVGNCYTNLNKLNDAMEYLKRSQDIFEKLSLDKETDVNLATLLNNISNCLIKQDCLNEAIENLQSSSDIFTRVSLDVSSDFKIAATYNNMGCCSLMQQKYDVALKYLQQSSKIYKKAALDTFYDFDKASTLHNLGFCFEKEGKAAEALNYLQQSLEIKQKATVNLKGTDLASTVNSLGDYTLYMGETTPAKNCSKPTSETQNKASLDMLSDINLIYISLEF